MTETTTVLVTDAEYISALSAVRSLGRAGYRVVAVSRRRLAHSFRSRYCARHAVVPDVARDPEAFLSRLDAIYRRERCAALVPVYRGTIRALLARPDPGRTTLLPPAESFALADDKARLHAWAVARGFPVPRSATWDGDGDPARGAREAGLAPPFVVKAAVGEGAREVRYADGWNDLHRRAADLAGLGSLLIQERAAGAGYGVSCLFGQDGRRIASFVHRRLRENPPSGGASVLRESVRWPELEALGVAILRALDWRGLAMAEFKADAQGRPLLLEINPRFWGSMPLAVAAGVDFPRLYVEEALGRRPAPVTTYPAGVRAHRLLFAGLAVLPHYVLRSRSPLAALRESFSFRDGRTHEDIFSFRDPGPAFGRLIYSAVELARGLARRVRGPR